MELQRINVATNNLMAPLRVILDFEEALGQAFTKVFPTATITRDYFHFAQANVKRMGHFGLKPETKGVVSDLRLLWYSPDKATFDLRLNDSLEKWRSNIPQYASYFESTWLDRFPPEQWASYARSADAPSGMWFFFFFGILIFFFFFFFSCYLWDYLFFVICL